MNINLTKLNIFKKAPGRISDFLKINPVLILAALLLAIVFASGAIFYFYVLQIPNLNNEQQIIKINKTLYQEVIDRLDSRATNIQQGMGQGYQDVFR